VEIAELKVFKFPIEAVLFSFTLASYVHREESGNCEYGRNEGGEQKSQ